MSALVELRCRLTNSVVSLHEPVFIGCAVVNPTKQVQRVDLGANRVGAFQISVEPPKGPATFDLQLEQGGLCAGGERELPPRSELEERMLLQRWHSLAAEGRYIISVALKLEDDRVCAAPLRLDILPRDTAKLSAVCASLSETALAHGDPVRSGDAAEALTYIADRVAVPYLKQLLTGGHNMQLLAIAGLGRIDDDAARTILRELCQNRNLEVAALSRRALRRISAGQVMD